MRKVFRTQQNFSRSGKTAMLQVTTGQTVVAYDSVGELNFKRIRIGFHQIQLQSRTIKRSSLFLIHRPATGGERKTTTHCLKGVESRIGTGTRWTNWTNLKQRSVKSIDSGRFNYEPRLSLSSNVNNVYQTLHWGFTTNLHSRTKLRLRANFSFLKKFLLFDEKFSQAQLG